MNRKQRRALENIRQNLIARNRELKLTHKIAPQTCVLWVPELKGYIAEFCPHGCSVVEHSTIAKHYDEDEAASAALAFREVTRMRVVVRPFYPH